MRKGDYRMPRNNFTTELGELNISIGKILIMVVSQDRISTAAELLNEYTREFHLKIEDIDTTLAMERAFGPFVNNTMSVIETLGIPTIQFKPVRKLILNAMYKLKDEVLLPKMSNYKVG